MAALTSWNSVLIILTKYHNVCCMWSHQTWEIFHAWTVQTNFEILKTQTSSWMLCFWFSLGCFDVERSKDVYRHLLCVFDKVVLPTHASCHVQYFMFYLCSFRLVSSHSNIHIFCCLSCWECHGVSWDVCLFSGFGWSLLRSLMERVPEPVTAARSETDFCWIHGQLHGQSQVSSSVVCASLLSV